MKKIVLSIVLSVGIVLSLLCFSALAETLTGQIVGVHDGDTATLLTPEHDQVKIRLAQIDAPELKQAFGMQSKKALSDLIFGKSVTVDKETIDRYGRTVGTIFVGDLNANKEQVKTGFAWVYRQYLRDNSLLPLEDAAKVAKVGLWVEDDPVEPWEFRHKKK